MSDPALTAPLLGGDETVELPSDAFGAEFHEHLVHEAVRAELAARRRGTASTRTRGAVRGGGAKPWRQKGTGRARAGSNRSPIWTGGGTTFGPLPRSYTLKVNRKARTRALRSALSLHAQRGSLAVFDGLVFTAPRTKKALEVLGEFAGLEYPVLVVASGAEDAVERSFRNLPGVDVRASADAGVADIVRAATLLVSQAAFPALERRAYARSDARRETAREAREAGVE